MSARPFLRGVTFAQLFLVVGSLTALAMLLAAGWEYRYAILPALEGFTQSRLFFYGCIGLGVGCVAIGVAVPLVQYVPLNADRLLPDPSDSDPRTYCAVCDAPPKEK